MFAFPRKGSNPGSRVSTPNTQFEENKCAGVTPEVSPRKGTKGYRRRRASSISGKTVAGSKSRKSLQAEVAGFQKYANMERPSPKKGRLPLSLRTAAKVVKNLQNLRNSVETHTFLRQIKLFACCSEEEIRELADAARKKTFDHREVVIHQGDPGDSVYVIRNGNARITVGATDNSDPHCAPEAARLEIGDHFGELALLHNKPRNANVVAYKSLQCLAITRDVFLKVMDPLKKVTQLKKRLSLQFEYDKEGEARKWENFQKKLARERNRRQTAEKNSSNVFTKKSVYNKSTYYNS